MANVKPSTSTLVLVFVPKPLEKLKPILFLLPTVNSQPQLEVGSSTEEARTVRIRLQNRAREKLAYTSSFLSSLTPSGRPRRFLYLLRGRKEGGGRPVKSDQN